MILQTDRENDITNINLSFTGRENSSIILKLTHSLN